MEPAFELLKGNESVGPRRGRLRTLHGTVETPIFMPVGTQGTVKGLLPAQIKEAQAQIILGNTYHLNLRPTSELIRDMGGLHAFMRWDKPILTDSGGFQVFSLSKLRKIRDDGIRFQSHLDGREVILTPKRVLEIQANLGSDIAMVLDECPPADADRKSCEAAVERTVRWAREAHARTASPLGRHFRRGRRHADAVRAARPAVATAGKVKGSAEGRSSRKRAGGAHGL